MKKVLIISYFFPPMGGSGVIRVAKFTKYLRDFGYEPYVLTVEKGFYPLKDPSLLAELPKDLKIERVSYFEPGFWFQARFWQSFLKYFLYPLILVPDNQILWFWPALLRAIKIIRAKRIKIVFTSSSSYSDHLLALVLKKIFHLQWVADFRDEWTTSPYFKFPTLWHRRLAQFLQKQILKNANKVTTVSPGLTKIYQQLWPQNPEKFLTITNGFDRQDYPDDLKYQKSRKLRIVYAGTLYGPRKGELFFQALKELNLQKIEVDFWDHQPHQQVSRQLMTADLLLLILAPQDGPAVLTGKVFEYLAARRPILALAPKNSGAARLIKKLKAGIVVDPLDLEGIKKSLRKLYALWQNDRLILPKLKLDRFERRYLTGKLAAVFDALLPAKKIKLCLIGNLDAPQNRHLVEFFKTRNFEIHFLTTTPVTVKGIKTYYLGPKGPNPVYFLKTALKVRRLIKKIRPDIVHGQDLVLAGIWAYLAGFKPLVVTLWGSDVLKYNDFIKSEKYLIKKTLSETDLVTGPAEVLKKAAVKIGLDPDKFHLIHFGVDLDIFRFRNRSKAKNLRGYKIIFCPRSIAPLYNTDILIEAFRRLRKKIKAKLLLVGQNADDDYLLAIEKKIIKYNLVDDCLFLPRLSPRQMAHYYSLADVVVSLASSDGCPRSFLEALACQCKIVVTKLPFTREWGTGFWTVPVKDVAKTAAVLWQALKFPAAKWRKIGQANRRLVAERAEIKANFSQLAKLYRDL